jgi:hypothetical protein
MKHLPRHHRTASEQCTETLVVQPGQYIEWTLETDLARSSVGVY